MSVIKNSKENVMFNVVGEHEAHPASLVRLFTNIKNNQVSLSDKYNIQEVMNHLKSCKTFLTTGVVV